MLVNLGPVATPFTEHAAALGVVATATVEWAGKDDPDGWVAFDAAGACGGELRLVSRRFPDSPPLTIEVTRERLPLIWSELRYNGWTLTVPLTSAQHDAVYQYLVMEGRAGPWRYPDAETEDYPGLWVHDGRQSGSITLGRSRLPVGAVLSYVGAAAWEGVVDAFGDTNGWDADRITTFVVDLLQVRGEFARLLCVLADEERREREQEDAVDEGQIANLPDPWWSQPDRRERVAAQLRRCLTMLEGTS